MTNPDPSLFKVYKYFSVLPRSIFGWAFVLIFGLLTACSNTPQYSGSDAHGQKKQQQPRYPVLVLLELPNGEADTI